MRSALILMCLLAVGTIHAQPADHPGKGVKVREVVDGNVSVTTKTVEIATEEEVLSTVEVLTQTSETEEAGKVLGYAKENPGVAGPPDHARLRISEARQKYNTRDLEGALSEVEDLKATKPNERATDRIVLKAMIGHRAQRADVVTSAIRELQVERGKGPMPKITAHGIESEQHGADPIDYLKLLEFERAVVDAQNAGTDPFSLQQLIATYPIPETAPDWVKSRWLHYHGTSLLNVCAAYPTSDTTTVKQEAEAVLQEFIKLDGQGVRSIAVYRLLGDYETLADVGLHSFEEWAEYNQADVFPVTRPDGTPFWQRTWNSANIRVLITTASAFRRTNRLEKAKALLQPLVEAQWFMEENPALEDKLQHPRQNFVMFRNWALQEFRSIPSWVQVDQEVYTMMQDILSRDY